MSNITCRMQIKKNEAGFTFIELLLATVMSLVILGLLAHVFRAQQKDFSQQSGLNTMQANGRAATEFISRSVQNAGFNVQRGTRFLSATDHSLTAVYDSDNDGVIQNDEVITYALANTWSGTASETFTYVGRYDVNGDGAIQASEAPTVTVGMTVGTPPFNLYKVTPVPAGTSVNRDLVARNIDNMVIKYYDRDGKLLPRMSDTDGDGVGDVAVDVDSDTDELPDNGNWTYTFPDSELNDIRKVEIEILARSRKKNPRGVFKSGSYVQGSLAAVKTGGTSYNDEFMREDFTAHMAPRNLIQAPWGSVAMTASPTVVTCPNDTTVTATLLDTSGDPVSGETINFTATGKTSVTLGTPSPTSDSNGEGSTTLAYDFTSPYFTSTISGSALVDDGSGELKPIYNATPVSFSFGAAGGFVDPFDGSQIQAWTDLGGTGGFTIAGGAGLEHFKSTSSSPSESGSLNGCASWQDYSVQTNIEHTGTTFKNQDHYGIILRHQNSTNFYYVRLKHFTGGGGFWLLDVGAMVGGGEVTIRTQDVLPVIGSYSAPGTYTIKAQIEGNQIKAKFWQPADKNDPSADEPAAWLIDDPDPGTNFASGNFGLWTRDDTFQFDNVSVLNVEGS